MTRRGSLFQSGQRRATSKIRSPRSKWVCLQLPDRNDQNLQHPLASPDSECFPFGEIATDRTASPCPSRVSEHEPVASTQTLQRPSKQPVTIKSAAGQTAMERIGALCPNSVMSQVPLSQDQTFTELSKEAVTTRSTPTVTTERPQAHTALGAPDPGCPIFTTGDTETAT